MRIVVLDGHTLNPGDLSWGDLKGLGECEIYDRTPPGEVVKRSGEAEVILTNKTIVTSEHLENLPRLRYIGVLATGYNNVDIAAARSRGIPVTNVPDYGTPSVAQTTFALLLELAHHVGHHSRSVRDGRWSAHPDFCYWDFPLIELAGLTFGIVGYGRIGQAVGRLARAFGMTVLVHTPHPPEARPVDARFVGLDELFEEADVVSLHCPLTEETARLVNASRLGRMKRTAFLLNTGRGPLIDEPVLAKALAEGRIAGAGLDVLSVEPPPPNNPLLTAPRCLITPHLAWATQSARSRLMATVVANLQAFLDGHSQNVVNP